MTQFHAYRNRRDEANSDAAPADLLTVSSLTVATSTEPGKRSSILSDVSFTIAHGEVLGVLGESGAGKTTLGRALLRLLPQNFEVLAGTIALDGSQLLGMTEEEMRSLRGDRISTAFQDCSSLNPVLRVEHQVVEIVRAHRNWKKSRCREEARAILQLVGLGEERLFSAYPHQLSGGQKQRVAIAQALVCGPQLLIADEPTASLDPVTTLEILALIESLSHERRMAVLFISHQPAVLACIADRVAVLYGGQIVEEGPAQAVLTSPLHPYTRALLSCQAPLIQEYETTGKPRWPFIPLRPSRDQQATGCIFDNRCTDRDDLCSKMLPPVTNIEARRQVRCFKYAEEGA